MKKTGISILLFFLVFFVQAKEKGTLRVGAKHFNEGYILSEIVSQLLEQHGYRVDRKFNLGGTAVIFEALHNGGIDVYPEYTGTLVTAVLNADTTIDLEKTLRSRYGMEVSGRYGFTNSYALLVSCQLAEKLKLHKISDLTAHPGLVAGFSHEFLERNDGWQNLRVFYGLPQTASGIDHGLAYSAIKEKSIDITDAYSTDGEIQQYALCVLEDDRHFFPGYYALSLYRSDFPEEAKKILAQLEGKISADEMRRMNALALSGNKTHAAIASDFLLEKGLTAKKIAAGRSRKLVQHIGEHLELTFLALAGAVLAGLLLGLLIYRFRILTRVVLYITGILQTIPSIALLALMIPLMGIGVLPAVTALFLYALLPVLRGVVTGLTTIDPSVKQVAIAMGMSRRQCLFIVELPLAMPVILSGIRTAAVISVGTATLAAFIGAGGLGEFIVTGLALNNTELILTGAIPAALLAVIMELLFEALEWWLVPGHLRQKV